MNESSFSILSACSSVCVFSQVGHELEECRRLTDKEPVVDEGAECRHSRPLRLGWTNNRTRRELAAKERRCFRHDQVGLKILSTKRTCIQVWEHQLRIERIGNSRRVPGFVVPSLEMGGLRRPDA